MKRSIIITEDGSHTLYLPEMDEHYHSVHGAVQESMHVFINTGFNGIQTNKLTVFEVGFGTGLNAWLTLVASKQQQKQVNYYTIEKYPLKSEEYCTLNYGILAGDNQQQQFLQLHNCEWEQPVAITPSFRVTKLKADLTSFNFENLPLFDLIYFDAFAPNKQEGLWNTTIFQQLFDHCNNEAILVTYSAKGDVRRSLQAVGFNVERIPGPPGKREMLRARKR